MKHQTNKDSLGEVVEYVKKGRGGSQIGGSVIQSCGIEGNNFLHGDWGTFSSDVEEVEGAHTGFMRKITGKRSQR